MSESVEVGLRRAADGDTAPERELLRVVSQLALDPHVVLDAVRGPDRRVVDFVLAEANDAACAYHAMTRDELVGTRLHDLLPGLAGDPLFDRFVAVLDAGETLVADEYPLPHDHQGGTRLYDVRGVRVGDAVSCSWRDVTDRVVEAQHLAESERRYRLLAENASDFVAELAPDWRIRWVSPAVTAALGWAPEEMVGRYAIEFAPDFRRSKVETYMRTLGAGNPVSERENLLRADGTRRWLSLVYRPVLDGAGRLTAIVGAFRDVQGEVEAEEAVARANRRFQLLAENSSDVVALEDPDERVTWISPNVLAALGRDPYDVMGERLAELVHPDDRAAVTAARARLLDPADPAPVARSFVLRFRRGDGSYVWMLQRTIAIAEPDAPGVAWVTGLRDVDELIRARQQAQVDEELLRVSADAAPDPQALLVAVWSPTGEVLDFVFEFVNQATCDYLGMPRSVLNGTRLLAAWPGLAASGLLGQLAGVLDSGRSLVLNDWLYGNEVLRAERRYDLRAARVPGGRLVLTWRDVTERYEAAARVAESEQRFRLLAENASDVVVLVYDGVMQWLSPSLTRMLGWLPSDWAGRRIHDFAHPDDDPATVEARGAVVRGEAARARFRVRDRAGDWHWIEVHANRMDADDPGLSVVASFRTVDDVVAYEQELHRRAEYDDLTGVLKRDALLAHLSSCALDVRRPGTESALVFVDLDRFKDVNDTHGHAAGDAVLRAVAERLRSSVRETDLVARMGGDEFLVVLHGLHGVDEAVRIGEKMRATASRPVLVPGGVEVAVTLSVGVTLRDVGEGADALIARADRAMYQAKQEGRDQVVAFGRGVASAQAATPSG